MRFKLYALAALLSISAGFLNGYAVAHSLYWVYSWFDVPVHILASAMVYVVVYALLFMRVRSKHAFWYSFCLLCAVGIGWEIFEYVSGATRYEPGLIKDTLYDLLSDVAGGLMGAGASWYLTRAQKSE